MLTFKEITGYNLRDYVIMSLPEQVHITDERRETSINIAIRRYTKLLEDGLPMGYKLDGEIIVCENENDPCPIGYPSIGGMLNWTKIIDELNFQLVLNV